MHYRYSFAFILWLLSSIHVPFYINTTNSMPKGIYLVTDKKITRGSYVAVCLPSPLALFAFNRGYLFKGNCPSRTVPLLKQVVATENDHIKRLKTHITVNATTLPHSNTFSHDRKRMPLYQTISSDWILGKKELWLYGTQSAHSWDSRYFGPIAERNILYVVYPYLTFNGSTLRLS